MEIQLILGPNNSGKSLYAEELAVSYAGHPLFYLATMVPQTDDNYERIEKHRKQRQGKGFTTIEEPWDIDQINLPSDAVVLLEDASNLTANGVFLHHSDAEESYQKILSLADRCRALIIVSIAGLNGEQYEEETRFYIEQLNLLNQKLENTASKSYHFYAKEK